MLTRGWKARQSEGKEIDFKNGGIDYRALLAPV